MSTYTEEENKQFKIEYDKILANKKIKKLYKKKWQPKKSKRKRGLKRGEWKS